MTDKNTNLKNNREAENRAELGASEFSALLPCPCGHDGLITKAPTTCSGCGCCRFSKVIDNPAHWVNQAG